MSLHVGLGRAAGSWASPLQCCSCQDSARSGKRRQGHRARHNFVPVHRFPWPTGVPGEFPFGHLPFEFRNISLGFIPPFGAGRDFSSMWLWAVPCEQGLVLSSSLLYPRPLKLCLALFRGFVNICWMTKWTNILCPWDALEHIDHKHGLHCQTALIHMLTLPLTTWPATSFTII